MTKQKGLILSALIAMLIFTAFPCYTYADSAESPSLTIIVTNPPNNLSLSLISSDGSQPYYKYIRINKKAWETYYRFFGIGSSTGMILSVQSSDKSFECVLPDRVKYNGILKLDLKNETLTDGNTPARIMGLVMLRIALTLIIEGLIFFAFGYRKISSWVTFVVVNLLTQGTLNLAFSGPNADYQYWWIFVYVFGEIIIFLVEAAAFALILQEHRKRRALGFAFCANFASLVLGGLLISNLPI